MQINDKIWNTDDKIWNTDDETEFIPYTLWDHLKIYFNERQNTICTRHDILDHFYNFSFSTSTIDIYRNYLEKAGYMEKVGRGKYKVIKHIDEHLTIRDCKREACHNPSILLGNIDKYKLDKTREKYAGIIEQAIREYRLNDENKIFLDSTIQIKRKKYAKRKKYDKYKKQNFIEDWEFEV